MLVMAKDMTLRVDEILAKYRTLPKPPAGLEIPPKYETRGSIWGRVDRTCTTYDATRTRHTTHHQTYTTQGSKPSAACPPPRPGPPPAGPAPARPPHTAPPSPPGRPGGPSAPRWRSCPAPGWPAVGGEGGRWGPGEWGWGFLRHPRENGGGLGNPR